MKLRWLYARHFRLFTDVAVEFSPDCNQVVGQNGQGKTTVLEAIYLCMTSTSFRTSQTKELIQHNQAGFFVEVGFERQGITTQLQLTYDGHKKRISINGQPCDSPVLLLGQLVGVVSYPEIQSLIKGAPQLRRYYLDMQIAQTDPLYVHHMSRYKRALKQRNVLLKQKEFHTIEAWEEELAHSAVYIASKRAQTVAELTAYAEQAYHEIAAVEAPFSLHYETKAPLTEPPEEQILYYKRELLKRRHQEAAYGATLVGPHRDDMQVLLDHRPVRQFGSEGQIRLAALALKFAEWHSLHRQLQGQKPLMMVDDFAAYLDPIRRERLSLSLSKLGQVFLSSHEAQRIESKRDAKVFSIEQGAILLAN